MATGSKIPGMGWARPVFQLGKGKTLAVPMDIHAKSRQRLRQLFAQKGINTGIILLKGGEQETQYDSDTEIVFR